MKKLLFICLMIISSLFVFADGNKTTCKVSGLQDDVVVTLETTETIAENYGSEKVLRRVWARLSKDVEEIIVVKVQAVDKWNRVLSTEIISLGHGTKRNCVMMKSQDFEVDKKYKIEIVKAELWNGENGKKASWE